MRARRRAARRPVRVRPSGSFTVPPEASSDAGAAAEHGRRGTRRSSTCRPTSSTTSSCPKARTSGAGSRTRTAARPSHATASGSTTGWRNCSFAATPPWSCCPRCRSSATPIRCRSTSWSGHDAVATQLCGDGRVLLQGHAVPNVGRIEAALDGMRELHASHPIAAWKVYTHAPGPGWSFVDDTGQAFLSTVEEMRAVRWHAHRRGAQGTVGRAIPRLRRRTSAPRAVAHPDLQLRRVPLGLRRRTGKVRSPRTARASTVWCVRCATPAWDPAATCTPSSGRRGGR